jgi:hypothetical protein
MERESSEKLAWVLEPEVFSDESFRRMREAVIEAGHEVIPWNDEWWTSGRWPRLADRKAIFHGSLGNAAQIRQTLPWRPGAYCDVRAFHCSSWYPLAAEWLVHRQWSLVSVETLVGDPRASLASLGGPGSVFVRPDSPLKPFSGRVLRADAIDLKALDHGLYYDDLQLPVIVAPVRALGREWRYVVADRRVVAGSAYSAEGRDALPDDPAGAPWQLAAHIAQQLAPPEDVYVLDLCEADGELRLLELNPFSGADLYACSRAAVVAAVSQLASRP